MRFAIRRRTAVISLLFCSAAAVAAQRSDWGVRLTAAASVHDRWDLFASTCGYFEHGNINSRWGRVSAGACFKVHERVTAFGAASAAGALYSGLDNVDKILTLTEGASITTKRRLRHTILLQQRRYVFEPWGGSVVGSRMAYSLGKMFDVGKAKKWGIGGEVRGTVNIKSETSESDFWQRLRLGAVLQRIVSESLTAGLQYAYSVGGKNQTYMGDAHNLHMLTLFVRYYRGRK